MMSKKPLEKTNIYLFPVVANGVMIFLNLNKLSQRKDEIGEICHDLQKNSRKASTFQGGGCKAEKMNASIVINRYKCYNKSWTDR